ncbi:MAG: hypothetical protein WDO16_16685 [Bacteroidota bacterium]
MLVNYIIVLFNIYKNEFIEDATPETDIPPVETYDNGKNSK